MNKIESIKKQVSERMNEEVESVKLNVSLNDEEIKALNYDDEFNYFVDSADSYTVFTKWSSKANEIISEDKAIQLIRQRTNDIIERIKTGEFVAIQNDDNNSIDIETNDIGHTILSIDNYTK